MILIDFAGGFKDTMDKAEAAKVLGVKLDTPEKDVNDAYRKLMMANHPDRGGSPFISEKINEAKNLLDEKYKGASFDKMQ